MTIRLRGFLHSICAAALSLSTLQPVDAFQLAYTTRVVRSTASSIPQGSISRRNYIDPSALRTSRVLLKASDAPIDVGGELSSSPQSSSTEFADTMIIEASKALRRVCWLSWWAQMILTVVSSVTLLFARNVGARSQQVLMDGLFLAGSAVTLSFMSIIWTWSGSRLARRFQRRQPSRIVAANMTRRNISVGITLNLVGMILTLVGAQAIVGGLAVKVLTQQGMFGGPTQALTLQTLQPLDILIVQANTNTLMSHFFSLAGLLYLTKVVRKLDPPSVEGDERKRE